MSNTETLAIVSHGPLSQGQWRLEAVEPRPIRGNEILVKVIACGICAADIHAGDASSEHGGLYPRVLGHEGTGYVEQVGVDVKDLQIGDPVLLSFYSCGQCDGCRDGEPAHCATLFETNFLGEKGVFSAQGTTNHDIGGLFFGQSSFSSRAIVHERCVVNLKAAGVTEKELKLLAPGGCGVQTGSGAFINTANVGPEHEVAVIGLGGVGMSAVMAAKMRNCQTIIAIDNVAARLQLAKLFGATDTIDTSKELDLVAVVRRITSGRGVNVSLDTTGVQKLARQSWDFVRPHGKVLQVGIAKPGETWDVPMSEHMTSGKQIIGVVEGDANPQEYVPKMLGWYRSGQFPLDQIVGLYSAKDYAKAVKDMRSGTIVKPVLLFE